MGWGQGYIRDILSSTGISVTDSDGNKIISINDAVSTSINIVNGSGDSTVLIDNNSEANTLSFEASTGIDLVGDSINGKIQFKTKFFAGNFSSANVPTVNNGQWCFWVDNNGTVAIVHRINGKNYGVELSEI